MDTLPLSKPEWIGRCAACIVAHEVGISAPEAVNHADELWKNVAQDLSPETAADMAVGSLEAIEHLFCHC